MKNQRPSKFIGFFKFMEAMKAGGCPVCRQMVQETRHAMESFLYESVNDPGVRQKIRNDRGLCHRHSWQLTRFGDVLGSAILFRDVLDASLASAGVGQRVSRLGKRGKTGSASDRCFFCRGEGESRALLMSNLVAHIDDAEMSAGWEGPAVLCIPHLNDLCGLLGDSAARGRLVELHRRKYQLLCDEMTRLIEKQSYDHNPEEIGPEKDSWLRAVEALVGMPDVR